MTTKPTEQDRYQLYVLFCLRALIPPVTFTKWQSINAGNWHQQEKLEDARAERSK